MTDQSAPRGGLSPLTITSLIVAVAATLGVVVLAYLDANASTPPPPRPPSGVAPPAGGPNTDYIPLLVAIGFATVAWLAVLVAFSRDHVVRRIEQAETRVLELTLSYGEAGYTEGYLKASQTPPKPRTDPDPRGGLRAVPPHD